MDNLKQFFEKVQTDAALQERLKAIHGKTVEEAAEAVIALAKENGFEVTRGELLEKAENARVMVMENAELNEEVLDTVAGGGLGDWVIGSVVSGGLICIRSLVGYGFSQKCYLDSL